jgi:hypothetical protein
MPARTAPTTIGRVELGRFLSLDPVPEWDRLGLVAMTMLGVITGVAQVLGAAPLPGDAAVYWLTTPGQYAVGVYGYPPTLLQALAPLRATDLWWVFVIGWTTFCCASLGYVLGRWSLPAFAMIFLPSQRGSITDLWVGPAAAVMLGNVTIPMTAAIVAGMRRPGWWAAPILTKMTAGIGILWFAFRGEWRALAVGLGVTGAVALASFAVAPAQWTAFLSFATANAGTDRFGPPIVGPPLPFRLAFAAAIIAVAARTDRPRLVPVACAISVVGFYGLGTFSSVAFAALSPRLASLRPARRTADVDPVRPAAPAEAT